MKTFGKLFVVPLVIGIAGCGGSGSDSSSPDKTVKTFVQAIVGGDADKACDQLTPAAATMIGNTLSGGCKDAMAAVSRGVQHASRTGRFLKHLDITGTKITGGTATVMAKTAAGEPARITLTKVDGDWRISNGVQ